MEKRVKVKVFEPGWFTHSPNRPNGTTMHQAFCHLLLRFACSPRSNPEFLIDQPGSSWELLRLETFPLHHQAHLLAAGRDDLDSESESKFLTWEVEILGCRTDIQAAALLLSGGCGCKAPIKNSPKPPKKN